MRKPAAPRRSPDVPTRLSAAWLTVPIVLYVVLAARLVTTHVGYHVDEAIFVESDVYVMRGHAPAPLHYDSAAWTAQHGRRWPVMVMPYIGTVKDVVALPLFALFGVGADTARFAGVLLGAIGILGLVALLARRVHPAAGLATGALLAVNPSYLDFTVFDNGGASVCVASLGLVALALLRHLRRRSAASALLLGIAAGVGAWARLNVVWLLAALAAGGLFAFGRRALPPRRHALALAAGGLLGALPLLAYEAASGLATLQFIRQTRRPWSLGLGLERLRGLADVLIAGEEQRAVWGGPPLPAWQLALGGALLVLAFVAAALPVAGPDEIVARWRRLFGAATVAAALLLATSRLNVIGHHLVGALPLALAAAVLLTVELWPRRALAAPLAALLAALAAVSIVWDARVEEGLRATGGRLFWSSAIYQLAQRLETMGVPPERLKVLTWGLHPNLYVVSGGRVHGTDLFWKATPERSSRGRLWDDEVREGGTFLLSLLPSGSESLDAASLGFRRAYERYAGPRRETRFFDRSGTPVILLVEVQPEKSEITVDPGVSAPPDLSSSNPAGVAEWQTQGTQNPPLARACRFESGLRHHGSRTPSRAPGAQCSSPYSLILL